MKTFYLLLLSFFATNSANSQIPFQRVDQPISLDGVNSVFPVDYDKDGDIDYYTASSGNNTITQFTQTGNGFSRRVISNNIAGANSIEALDIDLDGDIDLVASGSEPGNHSLYWFENENNSLGFNEGINIFNNDTLAIQEFAITDIDQDGDYDIISVEFSTASNPGIIALWENINMEFNFRVLARNCIDGRQIKVIDWDEDNDLDLLISEGIGDNMTYWENKGNLVFEKENLFPCEICNSFDLNDFDGDGNMDIITSSFIDDEISYWLNDGSNNFTKTILEDEFDGPDEVLVSDLDNDGDQDIIVSFYNEDLLVVYQDLGNLNYFRDIIDNDFDGGRDIAIEDINNDNSLDIIGASLSDDKIIIWYNQLVISSNEFTSQDKLKVYPNPSYDHLNVYYDNKNIDSIILYNMKGEIVSKYLNTNQIDISYLSQGMYTIRVITEKNIVVSKIQVLK